MPPVAHQAINPHNMQPLSPATLVNPKTSIDEYIERADWRVNANANQGSSLGGMILNIAGKVTANYWFDEIYSQEVGRAHRRGDLHIHDLDMLTGYCAGWSLRQLLAEGFNGVANKIESAPPRHCRTALGEMPGRGYLRYRFRPTTSPATSRGRVKQRTSVLKCRQNTGSRISRTS